MNAQFTLRRSIKGGFFEHQFPQSVLFFRGQNIVIVQNMLRCRNNVHSCLVRFCSCFFFLYEVCFSFQQTLDFFGESSMDAPPFQSGTFDSKSRQISKRGSPHLRQVLFNVCSTILQHSNPDNPVFQFMDKKRSEGKHYYVYMVAGGAKFLRIYYARVKEALNAQDAADAVVA